LNRIAGNNKEAIADLKEAEAERSRLAPDITPTPLELAAHYRSALALGTDKRLSARARRFFSTRLKQGYQCFTGVLD
jgi:hypothetical protein